MEIALHFEEEEYNLFMWASGLGPDKCKALLRSIRRLVTHDADMVVSNDIAHIIKTSIAANLPSDTLLQLERLRAKEEVATACDLRLRGKQSIIDELQDELSKAKEELLVVKAKSEQAALRKEVELRAKTDLDQSNIVSDTIKNLVQVPLKKIEEYVDKFETKSSSLKGKAMEDKYFALLQDRLPSHEVDLVRNSPHEMDLRVTHHDESCLVDIKNYSKNVASKEVVKFEQDVRTNRLPAVLVSAASGIANKGNYTIDFIDSRYPVCFVTNVKGDVDQIISAITIVNSLEHFVSTQNTGTHLSPDTIHKMSRRMNEVNQSLKEMTSLVDQQKRLLRKTHLDSCLALISGMLDTKPLKTSRVGKGCTQEA